MSAVIKRAELTEIMSSGLSIFAVAFTHRARLATLSRIRRGSAIDADAAAGGSDRFEPSPAVRVSRQPPNRANHDRGQRREELARARASIYA